MILAWGALVSGEFRRAVAAIAAAVGIPDPSWLMAVMYFESRLNPAARNPASGATGLIQFMPRTAESLGTTTDALAAMTAEEQLEYVLAYLHPYAGRLLTLEDCYMAVLWPKAIGAELDAPLFSALDVGSRAYVQNRGLDLNQDGSVTKAEACARIRALLEQGLEPRYAAEIETEQPAAPIEDRGTPVTAKGDAPMFATLLPMILTMIPQLGQIFTKDGSPVAQRNAAAAAVVADTIVKATQATNLGDAVNRMQDSPAALAAAKQAVLQEPVIMGLLEAGSTGIEGARRFAVQMSDNRPWWTFLANASFWVALALAPLLYIVTLRVLGDPGASEQLKTVVVTAILSGLLGALTGFFFGSAYTATRTTRPPTQTGATQ